MPKTYPPEAKKTAFELYLTGMSLDEVIKRMRTEYGYASYAKDTLIRWREAGNWDMVREKVSGQAAQRKLDTSLDDLEESLQADLQGYQTKLKAALDDENQAANFSENMGLLLRVHGLMEKTLARRSGTAPVDKAALSLEVLELIVESLAELNPLALDEMRDHLPELGRRIKERYGEAAV